MSKNKNPNQSSDAEDYLARLDWQSKQWPYNHHTPWYLVPRWKYKAVRQKAQQINQIFTSVISIGIFVAFAGYLLYLIITHYSAWSIFLLVMGLTIAAIIFFAIYDAFKKPTDDD
jgi:hypothetical protein